MHDPGQEFAERWALLRSVIEDVLELPAAARLAMLRQRLPDPALQAEAEQLLAFEDDASTLFAVERWHERAMASATFASVLPLAPGIEVGPYRVLKVLGQGGMGVVYLAERSDGAFDQRVALKLLRENVLSTRLEERFRAERQILARLEHAGIARLLDGGVTAGGTPWFAMQYVEGRPIDLYCDAMQLDIPSRLRLFTRVADIVQAAHQQLVLHLDLKPANILIDAEGEPRLLDFGIGRLLTSMEESAQPTLALMTPRYASPEQASGGALSVASDVFSLTTLLYRMLTGVLPYPIEDATPLEAVRMIREKAPALPSRVASPHNAAILRGDLDSILLKGLRKEPADRYATVSALRSDVDRYLSSRPVLARKGDLTYRSRKLLRRHRALFAAAAVVALVLGASMLAILRSARAANREREAALVAEGAAQQQRYAALRLQHIADSQRAAALQSEARADAERLRAESSLRVAQREERSEALATVEANSQRAAAQQAQHDAEARLHDVRDIANATIMDVIPALTDLPGTVELRKRLTEDGLKYLNGMQTQLTTDPVFAKELARGYYTLGEVQGRPHSPSSGDRQAAIASYRSAIALEERNLARDPNSTETLGRLALIHTRIANIYSAQGDLPASLREHNIALPMFDRVLTGRKTTRWMQIANEYYFLAQIYATDHQLNYADPATAMKHLDRALALVDEIGGAVPTIKENPNYVVERAYIQETRALVLSELGHEQEAHKLVNDQAATLTELNRHSEFVPGGENWQTRADLFHLLAEDALQEGNPALAREVLASFGSWNRGAADGEGVFEHSERTTHDLLIARIQLAEGKREEPLAAIDSSLQASRAMSRKAPDITWPTLTLLRSLLECAAAKGMPPERAEAMYTEALSVLAALHRQCPGALSVTFDEARTHMALAGLAASSGQQQAAASHRARARELLAALAESRPQSAPIQQAYRQAMLSD